MSPLRRKKALDQYLDSYGETLPNDWQDYSVGNKYDFKCVFCDDYHQGHAVPRIDPLRNKERDDLGIFSCDADNAYVQQLRGQLGFEEEAYVDRDDNDHSNKRLNLLLNGLRFDPEVYKYYKHLTDKDRYATHSHKCYICDDSDWNEAAIQVPVNFSTELSGGEVNICIDCKHDIKDINEVYQSLLVKTFLYKECCPECKQDYFFTEEEMDYRVRVKVKDLQAEFICPKCAHDKLDKLEDTSVFYNFEDAAPRHTVPNRFVQLVCECCRRGFHVDRTVHSLYIDAVHKITETEYICEECYSAGHKKVLEDRTTVKITSNLYIRLIFAIFWDYEVFRFSQGRPELEVILTGRTDTDEIAEAISVAINETYALLHGDQLQIW